MSAVIRHWIIFCLWAVVSAHAAGEAADDAEGDGDDEEAAPSQVAVNSGAELLARAYAQRERGEYSQALATVKEGLALADQRGDMVMRASFLYVAGRTYWALADYTKAIELHLPYVTA